MDKDTDNLLKIIFLNQNNISIDELDYMLEILKKEKSVQWELR